MALVLIKETGAVVAGANAYTDVAEADAYLERHLYATDWMAATTARKEAALVWATQLLDEQVVWVGQRVREDQVLGWPRYEVWDRDGYAIASNVVPWQVKRATAELARQLLLGDRTAEVDTLAYSELEAGPLRIVFDRLNQQQPVLAASVLGMLQGLIEGGTTGRVRFARLART